MKKKIVLVTGSEGLIGKELVEILSKDDNIKIRKADLKLGDDLRYFKNCLSITAHVDEVYNLVGVKGSPKRTTEQPADFFAPMIQFNTNMLEASRINSVKKFLYVSSIAVEHPETDEYPAWAKLTGEKQIETYRIQYPNKTKYCIVRPANVYGRYDNFNNQHAMVITSLINKAMQDGEFLDVWGDGSQERDFINAKDVAEAMILCMDSMPQTQINLCTGRGIAIRDIAEIIAKLSNKKVRYDTSKPTGAQSRVMRFDGEKIGWSPKISIEDGIKSIFEVLNDIVRKH